MERNVAEAPFLSTTWFTLTLYQFKSVENQYGIEEDCSVTGTLLTCAARMGFQAMVIERRLPITRL